MFGLKVFGLNLGGKGGLGSSFVVLIVLCGEMF